MTFTGKSASGLTNAAVQGVTSASRGFINEGVIPTVTSTGISFTAPNQMDDSNSGLAVFNQYQLIEISNSPLNSNIYKIATVAAGTITFFEQNIQNESAGAAVEVRQG